MKIKLTIEDIEVGQVVTIAVDGVIYHEIDDPPGEEKPEDKEQSKIWAIRKTGTNDAG